MLKKKIMMTFPVSVRLQKLDETNLEQEMCFYLDEAHQTTPPEPTNPAVYLVIRPVMNIYTRQIGGYMDKSSWIAESEDMDDLIAQQGLKANKEMFYGNGYDSPMKWWGRRNEVWKIKI